MIISDNSGRSEVNIDQVLYRESALESALQEYSKLWPRVGVDAKTAIHENTEAFISAVNTQAWNLPAPIIDDDLEHEVRSFIDAPVFILGCKKSGTTLVRNLLDSHPRLVVLPSEGRYWTDFLKKFGKLPRNARCDAMARTWVRRFANSVLQPPFWLLGRSTAEGESPYVNFVRYFHEWSGRLGLFGEGDLLAALVAAFYSVTRDPASGQVPLAWVEKTPFLENEIRSIRKAFPRARFIHVVRDPRAVIASLKKMRKEQGRTTGHLAGDMILLGRSMHIGQSNLEKSGGKDYLMLRFEDLIGDPDTVMGSVSEWLGISDHPILRHPTVCGRAAVSNSAYPENRTSGRVYNSSKSKFKRSLESSEDALIRGFLRKRALMFGYDLPAVDRTELIKAVGVNLPSTASAAVKVMRSGVRNMCTRLLPRLPGQSSKRHIWATSGRS